MASVSVDPVAITYADLQSWPDDGRRYELYDGEVRVVPAPLPRHQLALLELQDRLRSYALTTGGLVLVAPIDIVFSDVNVLQPDIVYFTAGRRHHVALDRAIRVAPDVAVEVLSPATAAHDRGRKRQVFERFGVPAYWLLDPAAERIEILELRNGRYEQAASAGRGQTFASVGLQGFIRPVDPLFPWRAADASTP